MEAFLQAKDIYRKLTVAHFDVPHFQHGLSISWRHLGGVGKPGQDWAGAVEAFKAFNEALAISKRRAPH